MSNDLIARLRHQSDDHNALGMGIFREAADEIEALRADAARYRWLRDEDDDPVCSLRQLFTMTGKPKDVDAAVDAAMRKAVTP